MFHTLYRLIAMTAILLPCTAALAQEPVTAEQVEKLAGRSTQTFQQFLRDSFDIRMRYRFERTCVGNDDKNTLFELANKTSETLGDIEIRQKGQKQRIEDYQGDDWDTRYGQSGLWRRLSGQIYQTILNGCTSDFYTALTFEGSRRTHILHSTLEEADKLKEIEITNQLRLLRARILTELAEREPGYKLIAIEEYDKLSAGGDEFFRIAAAVERYRLEDFADVNKLRDISEMFTENTNIELVLELAYLQLEHDQQGLEKTLLRFQPQIKSFLGDTILRNLYQKFIANELLEKDLQKIHPLGLDLAAEAALSKETGGYESFFEWLSESKDLRSPAVLYVCAVKLAKVSPRKAIRLLIEASRHPKSESGYGLKLEPELIAEKGVQLAYNSFLLESSDCNGVLGAFENYRNIAQGWLNKGLEFKYGIVLGDCGKQKQAEGLFRAIAEKNDEKWQKEAKKILTLIEIRENNHTNIQQKGELLTLFAGMIETEDDCKYVGDAMTLLRAVIENIEQIDYLNEQQIVIAAEKMARFCYDCGDGQFKDESALLLAESVLLSGVGDKNFDEVKMLLDQVSNDYQRDNLSVLRCRARFFAVQGSYDKAGRLWAKICRIRREELTGNGRRSYGWWRAKFYELYCLSQKDNSDIKKLSHTIEVLQNSFGDIPQFWEEKLDQLKR